MDKESILQAVRMVIEAAQAKKGWSRRKLAGDVGVDENTLKRWVAGNNESFNLQALVGLFEHAGLSMDQLFGLVDTTASGRDQATPGTDSEGRILELEAELERYRWMIDQFRGQVPVEALAPRAEDSESAARDAAVVTIGKHSRLMQQDRETSQRSRKSG